MLTPSEDAARAAQAPAAAGLNALALALYRAAAGVPAAWTWPLRLVQRPEAVRAVLAAPEGFCKNYDFLTDFACGRLSHPGGAPWAARAALSRHWYRPGPALEAAQLEAIYAEHVLAALPADGERLFEALVAAAVAVFSRLLNLSQPLPWDPHTVRALRGWLVQRQWAGWQGAEARALARQQRALHEHLEALCRPWRADAQVNALLQGLSEQAQAHVGCPADFSAEQELALAVLAASETTASVLCWCAELLARHESERVACLAQPARREAFAFEVLRLFPPVPLMTRVSLQAQELGGERFAADEPIAVNLLGLHCDAERWARPMEFMPARWLEAAVPRDAWLPFSRGPRVCAGRQVALAEVLAGIGVLAGRCELQALSAQTSWQLGLSLRPMPAVMAVKR